MTDLRPLPFSTALPPFEIDPGPRRRLFFRALALAMLVTSVALPLVVALYWLLASPEELARLAGMPPAGLAGFQPGARFITLLLVELPVLLLVWGLLRLRTCLAAFAAGRPFSVPALAALRDFAISLGVSVLVKPLSGAALSVVLSWNAPPGQRQLALQVSSDTLLLLLFAGVIAALAWAMGEAAAIAEEHRQIV